MVEAVVLSVLTCFTAKFFDKCLNRTGDTFANSEDAIAAIDQFTEIVMIEMTQLGFSSGVDPVNCLHFEIDLADFEEIDKLNDDYDVTDTLL